MKAWLDRLTSADDMDDLGVVEEFTAHVRDEGPGLAAPLAALLGHPHPTVRWAAASGLRALGVSAAEAVPALLAALSDEDAQVRHDATEALAVVAPDHPEAIAGFLERMLDEDDDVRAAAQESLVRALPASAGALVAALGSPDLPLRREATAFFSWCPEIVPGAFPSLLAALDDADVRVRGNAAGALGHYGSDQALAARAVPRLVGLLGDGDISVRFRAASSLGVMGEAGRVALPALEALAQDDRVGPVLDPRRMAQLVIRRLTAPEGTTSPLPPSPPP